MGRRLAALFVVVLVLGTGSPAGAGAYDEPVGEVTAMGPPPASAGSAPDDAHVSPPPDGPALDDDQAADDPTLAAAQQSPVPSYPGDFPDPFVLPQGGTYWAYSTGSGGRDLQVMSSRDLRQWSTRREALAWLPAWGSRGLTWAPEVVAVGNRFVMYYTLRERASGLQCISVAVASRAAGPFFDTSSGPLVCQAAHFGSIDPSPITVGQTRYLLWKSDDNAGGEPTHLWGRQLAPDGLSWAGPPEQLLLSQGSAWQGGIIEGPSMIASGGVYYLFYGAGPWFSASAGIGYATCPTPLGPCTDQTTTGPWLASRAGASGPSGPATFRDAAGATRFAYHAWPGAIGYENGGVRAMFIDRLNFANGIPVLN